MRHSRLLIVTVATLVSPPTGLVAAPPPPPGGHIPIYFGGANQAGFPPYTVTSVRDSRPGRASGELVVRTAPNPFRTRTVLRFAVGGAEPARVRVFSVSGRAVREIAPRPAGAGWQEATWDGRDREGKQVPSGLYLFRVEDGARSATGRIVLLR